MIKYEISAVSCQIGRKIWFICLDEFGGGFFSFFRIYHVVLVAMKQLEFNKYF